MTKLLLISSGIKKEVERKMNTLKEYVSTGVYETERPYNIVEVNLELTEIGAHIDSAMENIKNELVRYYKRNGAKNIKVRNCWSTSEKVYSNTINKSCYAGWIELEFEKEIKNLGRTANNLDKKIEELVWNENKNIIKFNPELTAIDTKNSKSAELVTKMKTDSETKILDYGCGTGRNIRYMKNNIPAKIDGCDILEQLDKQKEKHSKLIDKRTSIALASELKSEYYDIVLNSHVLNVIESDEVKKMVVVDIFEKLKKGGKAIIEVRTKQDVEGAKTKEKHGDGWKIKKGSSFTYQEVITKEKMVRLVSSVGFKIEEHIYNSSRHMVQVVK